MLYDILNFLFLSFPITLRNWFSLNWSIIEFSITVFFLYIFFKDFKRRSNFFGYRPTAIMGLVDPDTSQILMIKKEKEPFIGFCQGGIYGGNIINNIRNILQRELGLSNGNNPEPRSLPSPNSHDKYQFRYKIPLGKVKIKNPYRIKRATLDSISLFKRPIGKAYEGCIIYANFMAIKEKIRVGQGIEDFYFVSIAKARQIIKHKTDERTPKKIKLLNRFLDEIEKDIVNKKEHDQNIKKYYTPEEESLILSLIRSKETQKKRKRENLPTQ